MRYVTKREGSTSIRRAWKVKDAASYRQREDI